MIDMHPIYNMEIKMSRLTDHYKYLYKLNLSYIEDELEEQKYISESKAVANEITVESVKLGLMKIETDILINDMAHTAAVIGGCILTDEILLLAKRHGIIDNSSLAYRYQDMYSLYLDCFEDELSEEETRIKAMDELDHLQKEGDKYTLIGGELARLHNSVVNTAIIMGSPFSADSLGLANRRVPKLVAC